MKIFNCSWLLAVTSSLFLLSVNSLTTALGTSSVSNDENYDHSKRQQQVSQAIKESVILDIDPGVDDALTLFLMTVSSEVDLRAITIVRGNANLENVKRNVVTSLDAVYQQYKYFDMPFPSELPILAVGQGKPLNPDYAIGPDGFMGQDGFGDIFTLGMYEPPKDWQKMLYNSTGLKDKTFFKSSPRRGPEEILYQLEQAPPMTVSILAVGPLTNIATAYKMNPILFQRAKRLVIMGGKIPYSGKPTAQGEFNFASDPDAAQIVLDTSKGYNPKVHTYDARLKLLNEGKRAPMEITLLPFDVGETHGDSNSITLSKQDYFEHIAPLKTPFGMLSTAMMDLSFVRSPERHLERNNHTAVISFDSITGVVLLDLLDGVFDQYWVSKYYNVLIETRNTTTLGALTNDHTRIRQSQKSNVRIALYDQTSRYHHLMMSRLFQSE